MASTPRGYRYAITTVALVCAIIGGQWLATVYAPASDAVGTGRSIGRTGFAYLGGLRTFVAAVLWNRIEPQFHEYYAGKPLADQTYMMPTLRLVTALDPQFQQAYYIASWIASKRVSSGAGLSIARAGVVNNPGSGLMHANLVQLLFLDDRVANRPEMMKHVRLILGGKLAWSDAEERFEGLGTVVEPLRSAGETMTADKVAAELAKLRAQGVGLGNHDHNGDGKQDH